MGIAWKKIAKPYSRYSASSDGNIRNDHTGLVLKPVVGTGGYSVCSLSEDNRPGVQRQFLIHRLVAISFLPKSRSPRATQVNHKNGVKTDNRAENLEWVTPRQNSAHARGIGLRGSVCGEAHPCAKINNQKATGIRAMRAGGFTCSEIAATFGLSMGMVSSICRRKKWNHIPAAEWE